MKLYYIEKYKMNQLQRAISTIQHAIKYQPKHNQQYIQYIYIIGKKIKYIIYILVEWL